MNNFRKHWYNVGLIVAILTIVYLIFSWYETELIRKLLLLNFVAILLHQFEEYGYPGGEPAIMNMVLQPSDTPNRYPLNRNSAMVVNVLAAYVFYLIPVFFPKLIWLALPPVLFGAVGQFVVHAIVTNRKLKTFYNPGLGAVVLMHIPIGVYYIYYVHAENMVTVWDWILGIIYLAFFVLIMMNKMTYKWLADKNSTYEFSDIEMERFGVKAKIEQQANNHL